MNKPIKVIHLLEWFELGGGIEKITGEIACSLNKDKFSVEIWCIDRGGKLVDVYRNKGVTVRVLNIYSYHNPLGILKLARLFKEVKPDIIHAHIYFASTIGRLAGKIANIKVMINHVHSTYWHYSPINLWVERFLSRWTDKIICVSGIVQDFVVRNEGIDEAKTVVVHNGVARQPVNADLVALKASLKIPKENTVIICVASLFENKGHRIIFEALSILAKLNPNISCLIVGDGPLEKNLKSLSKKLNLDSVISFLGLRTDIPELLSISDIFVLSSLEREGLPVSIIEAMAYGNCVIATQVGGVSEIIKNNVNGLLIPPYDPDVLAHAIKTMINKKDERFRLGLGAKQTFDQQFNVEHMVHNIEAIYAQCLASKTGD